MAPTYVVVAPGPHIRQAATVTEPEQVIKNGELVEADPSPGIRERAIEVAP